METRDLTIAFGGLVALDGVTIRVPVGERRAVIGPNGAGKTTLFNLLAGQLRPASGTVRLLGQEVTRSPAAVRARLGVARTFQLTNLLEGLTVEENARLAVVGARRRLRRTFWRPLEDLPEVVEPAERLLRDWDLWPLRHRVADELAHGQQRQLELVLALASKPRVLLLDEPTAGLTSSEAQAMVEALEALPADLTMLVIEHDMDVAFEVAGQVDVLVDGRVLASGAPADVREDPEVVSAYLGAVPDA